MVALLLLLRGRGIHKWTNASKKQGGRKRGGSFQGEGEGVGFDSYDDNGRKCITEGRKENYNRRKE
jgi:hypothetical protein